MESYTELDLQNALAEYAETGKLRHAAKNHAIPHNTLYYRSKGTNPAPYAQTTNQKLSPALEERLAEWILFQEAIGNPPNHQQIRKLGKRILAASREPAYLGKHWCRRFLKRSPSISTQRPRRIHANRADRACEAVIRPWFNYLDVPGVKAILPKNRYNMDETGIANGIGDNGLVIGSKSRKLLQKKKSGDRIRRLF